MYRPWQWLVIGAGFVMLSLIGWLDYVTGYEFGLFIFYSVPVGLLAWYVGRGPGIVISFASAFTWLIADMYAGQKYSSPFMLYWNTAVRSVCFIINAVTLAKIKQTLDQRKELSEALAGARQRLARLEGLVAACPVCQTPSADAGIKQAWDTFLRDPGAGHPPRNICPSCLGKFQPAEVPADATPAEATPGAPPAVAQPTSGVVG